jgi:iron-sulfur cluster repair protein YtfE (RIC family)
VNDNAILVEMSKADKDAQFIKQLQEQIKRLHTELQEHIRAEEVMIAAGIVSKHKVEQAHDIVRGLTS